MSALASVISPFSFSSAVELGNRLWSKKVLPVGGYRVPGAHAAFHARLYPGAGRSIQPPRL